MNLLKSAAIVVSAIVLSGIAAGHAHAYSYANASARFSMSSNLLMLPAGVTATGLTTVGTGGSSYFGDGWAGHSWESVFNAGNTEDPFTSFYHYISVWGEGSAPPLSGGSGSLSFPSFEIFRLTSGPSAVGPFYFGLTFGHEMAINLDGSGFGSAQARFSVYATCLACDPGNPDNPPEFFYNINDSIMLYSDEQGSYLFDFRYEYTYISQEISMPANTSYVVFLNGASVEAMAQTPNAIPEPATWVMLVAGFGIIGATLRRRYDMAAADRAGTG